MNHYNTVVTRKTYEWCLSLKIFICDYQIPRSEDLSSLVIEAEDLKDAELKAIEELKALNIPKRYIINMEEI